MERPVPFGGPTATVNQNVEPCPGALVDADRAAHQTRRTACRSPAQPGAAVFARRGTIGLGEGLETDRALASAVNADARVR